MLSSVNIKYILFILKNILCLSTSTKIKEQGENINLHRAIVKKKIVEKIVTSSPRGI